MKYTSGKWHPVLYADCWRLQTGPYYGDFDLFSYDEYEGVETEAEAKSNAFLASKAPEMYEFLKKAVEKNYFNKLDYLTYAKQLIKQIEK